MRKLNRLMAFAGALLFFLAAVALTAPLHGCARTGRAIGNLIESIGADMKQMAGPEPKALAAKDGE